MKFCKVIAGCVCAAACLMMSVQAMPARANPSVEVTVKADVPNIFEINDALAGNENKEVQLINPATGLPEVKTLTITPNHFGNAKIHISSANGDDGACRVKNAADEYLKYSVSYNNTPIAHDGLSAPVDFEANRGFELKFKLNDNQNLRAGTEYIDTLTVSFVAP